MPKKNHNFIDKDEADFHDALGRLIEGKPEKVKLMEDLKKKKLKINISTVAMEAGHSRTTLYKYSSVLTRIKEHKTPRRFPHTANDVIMNLRDGNAILKREKQLALSENAALIVRMSQLKSEHTREVNLLRRKLQHAQSVDQPENVISFPTSPERKE